MVFLVIAVLIFGLELGILVKLAWDHSWIAFLFAFLPLLSYVYIRIRLEGVYKKIKEMGDMIPPELHQMASDD